MRGEERKGKGEKAIENGEGRKGKGEAAAQPTTRRIPVALVVAACLAAGCGLGDAARDTVAIAIRSAHSDLDQAALAGDLARLESLHTEDAVLMAPGMPALVGRDAIMAHYRSARQLGGGRTELLEVVPSGDLAFVRGRYEAVVVEADGTRRAETGKMLEVWRRERDGQWRLARDMFNGDRPAP